jgi:hypothetical protein
VHLFGHWALWAAEALGRFDVALLQLLCSLSNPPYLVGLVALAWWLLTPYFEAVNYLFFIDDRTRYEGLDLWYRVDDAFSQLAKKAGVALLVLGATLLGTSPVRAETRLRDVRAAHDEIVRITGEVKQADPYPGGARWLTQLRQVGKRLDPEGTAERGRFRWYFQSIDGFEKRDHGDAIHTLDHTAQRLAMIADNMVRSEQASAGRSREQIKALVPPEDEKPPVDNKVEKPKPPPKEEKPVGKDEPGDFPAAPRGGAVLGGPVNLGGLGQVLFVVLTGLVAAMLLIAVFLALRHWLQDRSPAVVRRAGQIESGSDDVEIEPAQQDVASLWRQSDELASTGRFLEAVRTLYLAVLALLHQASLIRFERTRTNGEYADQLRSRKNVHGPFLGLTNLFEVKWYGERRCEEGDYSACRGYAESIRLESKTGGEGRDKP